MARFVTPFSLQLLPDFYLGIKDLFEPNTIRVSKDLMVRITPKYSIAVDIIVTEVSPSYRVGHTISRHLVIYTDLCDIKHEVPFGTSYRTKADVLSTNIVLRYGDGGTSETYAVFQADHAEGPLICYIDQEQPPFVHSLRFNWKVIGGRAVSYKDLWRFQTGDKYLAKGGDWVKVLDKKLNDDISTITVKYRIADEINEECIVYHSMYDSLKGRL